MKNSKLNFGIIILAVALVLSLAGNIWLIKKGEPLNNFLVNQISSPLTKTVSAKEIYPLFSCPCCGKPISSCGCPMAKERRAYVDGLTEAGVVKDKVILAYVKKYGLNSFIDKNRQKEVREKLIAAAPKDRPIISLTPETRDLGNVSQKKGVVTTTFSLKNEGKRDLIINRLETSCGCTSASIVFQGKEGPRFSMPGHGVNEKIGKWQLTIPAGEEAQLKVYYDPNVHKNFRGSATREIYVFSNDPVDFEKKVRIEFNQVD